MLQRLWPFGVAGLLHWRSWDEKILGKVMGLTKNHKAAISKYIQAKDNNKPHLMKAVFESSASLSMLVKSNAISFPSETHGLDSIANVLVSDFGKNYENVYTFCMTNSVVFQDGATICKWAVVMADKENGDIRVGFGVYKWVFNDDMVSQLTISIEEMVVLEEKHGEEIFVWASNKDYPWCEAGEFLKGVPTSIGFLVDGLAG